MTEPTAPPAENRPAAPPSDRVRIARLALDAALATDGVARGTDGPVKMWVTVDQGQRYPGVTASVLPDGTHSVGLHLVADEVPLHPLADSIRERAEADVAAAGLIERLGPIDITFEDLAGGEAEEPAAPPGAAPPSSPPPASPPPASPPPPPGPSASTPSTPTRASQTPQAASPSDAPAPPETATTPTPPPVSPSASPAKKPGTRPRGGTVPGGRS